MRAAFTLTLTFSNSRSPSPRLHIILAALICSFCFALPSSRAQESAPPAQHPIQATTEIVKVDVSVLDKHGEFVSGLDQKNFRVLDGGVEKPIVFFTPVEASAQVLVVVETSPAVYLIHNQHLQAAFALLDGLAPDDQVALATYDQAPHAILPFTNDKGALASALGKIQYTLGFGELNFFDSISTTVDWMAPVVGKRALVLLTTGLDSSSPEHWDTLVQKLRAQDVVIFPVALGGSLRQSPKKKNGAPAHPNESPLSFEKADAALRSLATITGGRVFFPLSSKDFAPMYREIAAELRHQYVLGIAPEHDGKFHALAVQVLDGSGQPAAAEAKRPVSRIFAREGYLAPQP
jgi:Ca-activated chloride channel homolog